MRRLQAMNDTIEGRSMIDDHSDQLAMKHLKQRLNQLAGPDRARFAEMVEASKIFGRSFAASETPSHRRFEIARGILLLIEDGQFDRELITSLCQFVTGNEYNKAGEGLADLNWKQAAQFAECCFMLTHELLDISYNPNINKFQIGAISHE
jgi:hypothetical protein